MWTSWRRLPQAQQDLLLAALIGVGWFTALSLINDSGLRPQNPTVSVVTGVFLVITVAFVRRFPRTMLVVVSVLYPFLYAAVGTGLAAQLGLTIFGQPEISDAALQSEIHLVPLLVVGYLAASSGVRRFTCLFFTMGSLAGLMIGLPTVVAIVLGHSNREILLGDRYRNLPSDIPSLYSYIDVSLFVFAEALICGMVLLGADARRRRKSVILLEQRNAELVRLRAVEAERAAVAERTRIARDLHDRIGQSLAYMAFELDNIVSKETRGEEVGPALAQLRNDVRGVIREVRDTLYDLRTDVSDAHDIADTLEAYVARIHERSTLRVELFCDRDARLPLLQEREMWRIAQEALTNVERHSRADKARVLWRCNGESAALEVTDNGVGFPDGKAGRLDSYGIMGMRERASSIGATLELTSRPNEGSRVRCSLVRTEADSNDAASVPVP